MNTIPDDHPWQTWLNLAKSDPIDAAIKSIHSQINHDVKEKSPTCNASGRCCDFKAYGHRLYVTGIEIAWVIQNLKQNQTSSEDISVTDKKNSLVSLPQIPSDDFSQNLICPYHIQGLCDIHTIRPMGCRLYFCDGTDHWQNQRYEYYQNQFKSLHKEHQIPYAYMEWTQGLNQAIQSLSRNL